MHRITLNNISKQVHYTTQRDSNMELLRIIAMLLVLIVHANFKALGVPSQIDVITIPFPSFLRFFCESISIICVNVFILISGWYGIRPKPIRFCSLLFQFFFIGIVIYITLNLTNCTYSWTKIEWFHLFTFHRDLWFFNSYIILYILAPILNYYVDNANQEDFKRLLVMFFSAQTLFGYIYSDVAFCGGFSPLSFIGLYLLSSYVKLYNPRFSKMRRWSDMGIFLGVALIKTLLAMILIGKANADGWTFYVYTSPLVIICSLYFFMFFTKVSFSCRIVNWIASSVFAVYLFHHDPLIFQSFYLDPIRHWHDNETFFSFLLYTSLLMVGVFALSILIDKVRDNVFKYICKVLNTTCVHK